VPSRAISQDQPKRDVTQPRVSLHRPRHNPSLLNWEPARKFPLWKPNLGANVTASNSRCDRVHVWFKGTRGICRERKEADTRSRPKYFGRMNGKFMQQLLQGLRSKITGFDSHYLANAMDTWRLQPTTGTSGHLPIRNETSSHAKKHGKIVHQKPCISSSTRPSNNVRIASPSSASQSLPSRTSLAQGVTLDSDQLIRTTS